MRKSSLYLLFVSWLIYGSFATAVVALLIIEAATLILLLGAQVIAELERKTDELTEEKLSGFET